MKTSNAALMVALVVAFAAVAAVALPFDPVNETADADPDEGIAPASDLPDETEDAEDGTGAALLGVGLVSAVLVLVLLRFWTIKVE